MFFIQTLFCHLLSNSSNSPPQKNFFICESSITYKLGKGLGSDKLGLSPNIAISNICEISNKLVNFSVP